MINVKQEKFEGPLGLLLRLIEKEELDITQISLAKIADQYIDYIRNSSNIDPENTADFLVVAAKLLLLKSKAILPFLYPEEDEEIEELERQLKIYKEFLEASKVILKILGKKKFMFAREFNRKAVLENNNVFSPPKKIDVGGLREVFEDILTRLQPVEKMEEDTLEYKVSIEEKILDIQTVLIERIQCSFKSLMKEAGSKTEVIVGFLAILELMRQKQIFLVQDEMFGEIMINKIEENWGNKIL